MKQYIGEQDDPIQRQYLKEEWNTQVSGEEEKSQAIWSKKVEFFENFPTTQSNYQHHRKDRKIPGNHQYSASTKPKGSYLYNVPPSSMGNHYYGHHQQIGGSFVHENRDKRNYNWTATKESARNFHQPYNLRQNR